MPSGDAFPPRVLGVLAGRDLAPGALEAWLAWADRVVAADGGADLCRAAGREPDAIVGDLDSIGDATGLVRDEDQDTSDADKLLAFLDREGVREATLIGVEGDRLDHVLATLCSCARARAFSWPLVLRSGSVRLLGPGCVLEEEGRGRVSLVPLVRSRVTATGLRWPLDHAVLDPLGLVSISNEIAGDRLAVTVAEGVVALFVETGAYPPVPAQEGGSGTGTSGEPRPASPPSRR